MKVESLSFLCAESVEGMEFCRHLKYLDDCEFYDLLTVCAEPGMSLFGTREFSDL